jgi:predicted MFS family arabinose efflux permease
MGVVLAPAIGPSVGGLLVDWFGWRSIFVMVVPFCLASLWLARRYVPTTPPASSGLASRRGGKLDWPGLLLAGSGTICLLNGLVQLHTAASPAALLLLLAAALAMLSFVVRQHRLGRALAQGGDSPLMNLALFANRPFAMGSIVAFIYGMALFGSTYLLPVYMRLGLMLSPSHVGTVLLPAGLMLGITIPLVGRLSDRQPTHLLVSIGLVLLASSFALMGTIGPSTGLWLLVVWAIVGRIGLGFILPSLNSGSLRGLHKDLLPQGSSSINFMRTLGGAAGVSICGIVLEWRLAAHGDALTNATSSAGRMAAFDETFYMLAALCALALLAAWRLRAGTRLGKTQ